MAKDSTTHPQCNCKPKCWTPASCACVHDGPALMIPLKCSACGLCGIGYLPLHWPFVQVVCGGCGRVKWFARRHLSPALAAVLQAALASDGSPPSASAGTAALETVVAAAGAFIGPPPPSAYYPPAPPAPCCDSPSPAVHLGQNYCTSCDADLPGPNLLTLRPPPCPGIGC